MARYVCLDSCLLHSHLKKSHQSTVTQKAFHLMNPKSKEMKPTCQDAQRKFSTRSMQSVSPGGNFFCFIALTHAETQYCQTLGWKQSHNSGNKSEWSMKLSMKAMLNACMSCVFYETDISCKVENGVKICESNLSLQLTVRALHPKSTPPLNLLIHRSHTDHWNCRIKLLETRLNCCF